MASATLSIGSSSYTLLDSLGAPITNQSSIGLSVSRSGAGPTTIKANPKGGEINNLGLGNGTGTTSSTTSIFGNVNQLEANLGGGNDTLNIFGNVAGSRIELDKNDQYNTGSTGDGNDSLSISGSLFSGLGLPDTSRADGSNNDVNRISTGAGNDTIRIAGQANDAFIYLGDGNDSLTVSGIASNLDVKAGAGNDAISFFDTATNVSVATAGGNDTVVFSKQLIGDDKSITFDAWPQSGDDSISPSFTNPSVDLGSGNDSLILGGGTSGPVAINTGSGNDTVQLKGAFDNTQFILDGRIEGLSTGKDRITASPNASFQNSNFISNNEGGDTLTFGNGTLFYNSSIQLGQPTHGGTSSVGSDSVVFGSNSSIIDSAISLGSGADTLVFGSNSTFFNSFIDLGSDSNADRIIFSTGFTGEGVQISGAGAGDTLYIGATAYVYNTTSNDFYNGSTLWRS